MKIEQILTLTNIEDGIYRDSGKILIKNANSISIIKEEDNLSLVSILNPKIKLASKINKISIVMPMATSRKYTMNELSKISKETQGVSLEDKVQKAIIRLASENKPMPDVDSIVSLASIANGNKELGVLTLKFAQWGGSGGMMGNEGGSFGMFSFSPGSVNQDFGRWQANIMFDAMLDVARKEDKTQWNSSTEDKLSRVGFYNHKFADENALKYNMTWSDRIKYKNLQRLKRIFEQREKQEEEEKARRAKDIRLNQPFNPRHYESVEKFLEEQRGAKEEDYIPKRGRLEENVPDWYSELNFRKNDCFNKYSYNFDSGSAPSRRKGNDNNISPERQDNYMGGIAGAASNMFSYPSESIVLNRETTANEPVKKRYPYQEYLGRGYPELSLADVENRTSLSILYDNKITDEQENYLEQPKLKPFDIDMESIESRLDDERFDSTTPQTDSENLEERESSKFNENIQDHYYIRKGR